MYRVPPRNSNSHKYSEIQPFASFDLVAPEEEGPEQLLKVETAHLEVVKAAAEDAEKHEEQAPEQHGKTHGREEHEEEGARQNEQGPEEQRGDQHAALLILQPVRGVHEPPWNKGIGD